MNGIVQDISPPGTPTNDDVVNTSNNLTVQNPNVFTPHGRSPLITNTLTPVAPHLVIPTHHTPQTPLLSPNMLLNAHNHGISATALLHPLQQALLLHQQQQTAILTQVYF